MENDNKKVVIKTWKIRFKEMKKALKLTNRLVAEKTGYSEDSIRTVSNKNDDLFPKGLKLAVLIYEENVKENIENSIN
jgi:hypothetical protein